MERGIPGISKPWTIKAKPENMRLHERSKKGLAHHVGYVY
jgi:hypothetical protein